MLHGSLNHVSITVRDLRAAMDFFRPFLSFLGYTVGAIEHDKRSGHDLAVNHVAFNVGRHEQVDELHRLVRELGGEILDGPGEFPFGPDRLKFEVVHMPELERALRERRPLA